MYEKIKLKIKVLNSEGHTEYTLSAIDFLNDFPENYIVICEEHAINNCEEFRDFLDETKNDQLELYLIPIIRGG